MVFGIQCLVLAACLSQVASNGLTFLAVGDWGGDDVPPYYTEAQRATSVGMARISAAIDAKFIVALGDNFYHEGVDSETSFRFTETWTNIYLDKPALNKPWYVCAGNHDHKGSVQAQIEYSNDNQFWMYPSMYHSKSFRSHDRVTVDLVLIDTVDLADTIKVAEDHPDYFKPLPLRPRHLAATQWDWIEAQLAASTADYLLVGGHFPVYSPCKHGPTATLVETLKPLLAKYGAHYMSGHDHCMSHIQEKGSNVTYFNTGMGVECCYPATNYDKVPTDAIKWYMSEETEIEGVIGGFSSFHATSSALTITYHDQDGNILYVGADVSPRNNKKPVTIA